MPEAYRASRRWPLFVALHGAGGDAEGGVDFFRAGERFGMVVLVPESRGRRWDRSSGAFGPDVGFLDAALGHVFERCAVDPGRICLGGFSDGASYALSLGLSNGDLFTHVASFSPGYLRPAETTVGRPRVWVSHGRRDRAIPVSRSREEIVPSLEARGYDVTYREYDGGHRVTPAVGRGAVEWFLGRGALEGNPE